MHRRMLSAFIVVALPLATAASLRVQSTSNPPAPTTAVSIPFELVNRHVILKVKVNNSRPLSFVLDTGDKFAIIDLDRAKELGLNLKGEVKMHGAGTATPIGAFVKDASFTVAGLPGFSQPVALALPIGNLAPRLGQDFDGIIGSDFIEKFVLELDYQARLIKLHDKAKFVYSGPGETIPIHLNSGGHPILEAEVTPIGGEPIKGKFVLDIGSSLALVLYSPFVAQRNLLGPNLKTIKAPNGAGAGGETSGRMGRVSELKIGQFRISNPITLFSEDKAGAFASSSVLGNIGAQVGAKFKILFDYSHDRIIFEPNASFIEPIDRAFGGLGVQAEGKYYRTFRIREVLENFPAAEAGLQKDDIITAIDGKPAAEFTLTKLNEMFEQTATYKLKVRRGDKTLHVTLTPRKML